MAGLKAITANTAPEAEPHIYAEDDAAIYQAITGPDGVYNIGQKCAATVLSNNKVRVGDGVICVGGHFARILYGEYEYADIANGQSGQKRNDIIMGKFVTTGIAGIDDMTLSVKQGVAGTTATDPALTQGDLYKAAKIREMPLYRVKIEGLSIVAVEQLFDLRKTTKELEDELSELNSKITNEIEDVPIQLNTTNFTTNISFAQKCDKEVKVYPYVIGVPTKGRTLLTGLPSPTKQINIFAPGFGQLQLNTNGILSISSQAATSSATFGISFSYYTNE